MPEYSVAEARNNLPKLLDRALAGETVTITRRGKPIARIVPQAEPGAMGIDLEWLKRVQVKPSNPHYDGQELIRMMKDDNKY
jgi:prevent-host-death family protein